MLGFGFNKNKVLANAERYVQQGKLQNAITEYEKIIKADPKDLTVLNTIGDLYARVGQVDQATDYFKKVGDRYSADGFTVKAIAMYKKLTKLNPGAFDCVQRLAELYTQQGLYSDARQQYLVVADQHMRNNELHDAARIFQRVLELDPENTTMQNKLADLYERVGQSRRSPQHVLPQRRLPLRARCCCHRPTKLSLASSHSMPTTLARSCCVARSPWKAATPLAPSPGSNRSQISKPIPTASRNSSAPT